MEKKIILCKNYDDITWFDGTYLAVSVWEHHISKRNYEITVILRRRINYISRVELQKGGPSDLVFPCIKYVFGIWDLALANSLWDNVIQNSIRQINRNIFPTVKSNDLLWKHLLPKIKYLFWRNSFECLIWIYIWYWQDLDLKLGYR